MQVFISPGGGPAGAPRGICPPQSQTYSDLPFTGQVAVSLPPGMVEQEIAASTYTVPATDWPIILRTGEILWGQSSFNNTTTEFSLLVWQGDPRTGTLVETVSSDGDIIPHISLPFAGSQVVDLQLTVDPQDPEQIIIMNDGSNKFSIGFRIDAHNNPPLTSCSCSGLGTLPAICCPVDVNTNSFPAMDSAGPGEFGSEQWLFARTCPGATGLCSLTVASGWYRLNDTAVLPASFVNDWTMRVIYEPLNCVTPTGACCKPDGTCESLTQSLCATSSGVYQGDASLCANVNCPQPTGACCFMPSGCVNLTALNCSGAGGTWNGAGSNCATIICFPTGACCMPAGNCVDSVLDTNCNAMGGTFQGHQTVCSGVFCPQPVGACCLSNGFCITEVIESDCQQIPMAAWMGMGTDCTDADMNSIADVCESGNPCDGAVLGDFDGSGGVDGNDVQGFVSALLSGSPTQGEVCAGDFDASSGLDIADVSGMTAALLN
ncbi:MAG: hypothetical protein H6818_01980 [Phycisphaerales bacterium]|nr:hypothetical protein [Phycisphaerales bacterium]